MIFKRLHILTIFLFILSILLSVNTLMGQRKMENLDRGLVAVKVDNGVFISWRIPGTEWYDATYNIYRDGEKLNSTPLEVSNFSDPQGTLNSSYTVTAVVNNTEQAHCTPATPLSEQYKEIKLKTRNTSIYEINDATTADLDGDGQYEIIVKRIAKGWNEDNTNYSYFEAYKQDGTFLWEINVGPNILPDVEINIAAFDFDEDGKAEVFMRTSEGTIFGDGTQIGDTDNDGRTNYRYSVGTTANMQYMQEGPEFLSLIDGETGGELDRVDFIPRHSSGWWRPDAPDKAYGHRASKYFFGAPYLDGKKPSLFIGRGIYTRTVMRTYDIVNKKLQLRWEWSAIDMGDPYYGQGNHNYTIADVDMDGRDEIVWGSMAVDDDGTGLYSTELGHGDAMHVGDLDPFRKGMEAFRCLEESPHHGTVFHDAATGEILLHHTINKDCGRCCAANISDDIQGAALWGGGKLFSASTHKQEGTGSLAENFRIYWDGDLLEELLDHVNFTTGKGYGTGAIMKHGQGTIFTANGAISNNYTKGTPSLQADLFGDWREEVVWRNETNTAIRIYTTVDPTTYRNYTLMHDHQYRQAVCWQMCGYNQPPHVSYFLGENEGFTTPPPPVITNKRLVYSGTGNWDKESSTWKSNKTDTVYADGSHVLFDISAGDNVSVDLTEVVEPKNLTVNSVGNYTFKASGGKLSGNMNLIKQGAGILNLNGEHDFTGKTEIWNGKVHFNGSLKNSKVSLMHFAELFANGEIHNSVTMRYGSVLETGLADSTGTLALNNGLTMEEKANIVFDLHSPASALNDSLLINGSFSFDNNVVFTINPHFSEENNQLEAGEYLLVKTSNEITGNIEKIVIEGITGTPAKLKSENGNIILEIKEVRQASAIEWNGDISNTWDFALTKNFRNNDTADIFVDQDQVTFNDNATSKTVEINSTVTPSFITVNASDDYTFEGQGKISGNATLTKSGTGTLTINNTNDFTGKVEINEGTVQVDKMPTSQSAAALGTANSDPSMFELNGGTLHVVAESKSDRAMLIGDNGGVVRIDSEVQWNAEISGNTLIKTGAGNLIFNGNNSHSKTILKQGTITMLIDETNPGNTVTLEGGTLQCNDNSYSYSTISWNIDVPEGKEAAINLDGRAYYTGTLTGSGTLNVNIPFVRSDLNGDMTEYDGTINFNASASSADLRINNSNGLPNAMVIINAGLNTYNDKGSSMILGALAGNGTLTGNENYEVGSKNTDSEFNGKITAGSLTKTGTGTFTLTNNNTYTGTTTIKNGTLEVSNQTGSATGSGDVSVTSSAYLSGEGIIGGNVTVGFLGKLTPGTESTGRYLTINKSLTLQKGSTLEVKANPIFDYIDHIVVAGEIEISGNLDISNSTEREFAKGDEFKLFDCPSITGTFENIFPNIPGDELEWDVSELESKGLIKVAEATSVAKLGNENTNLYPNPVNNTLFIDFEKTVNTQLKITNVAGKTCYNKSIKNKAQHQIDLSDFDNGVYLIEITSNNATQYFKILKQ
ncbi:MAG: autotransporter-associated beta strand repeat-containing protein [Prolixibacteraceae bacterium]|jgi:autotransporter-associated beta strand protein|nr:autotransporter-associated beta strand repeat-containing protein [Prolixibacteraceae bacterium]